MINFNSLSNTQAVLLEIQKIVRKKELLQKICSEIPIKKVSILVSTTHKNGVEKMIWINNNMLPYYLPNEIINILEDSIEQYSRDILSLNQHLKNL